MSLVWHNETLVKHFDATWVCTDSGMMLGQGLFETIRIENCKSILLNQHLKRLYASLKHFSWSLPDLKKPLEESITNYLDNVAAKQGVLRLSYSPGPKTYSQSKHNQANIILSFQAKNIASEPICLFINPLHYNPSMLATHKTRSYLSYLLHSQETFVQQNKKRSKIHQRLCLLSYKNNILECPSSNVCFIKKNTLVFPKGPLLKGVLQNWLLEHAKTYDIQAKEAIINIKQLEQFDEVFCLNSVRGIIPVAQFQHPQGSHLKSKEYTQKISSWLNLQLKYPLLRCRLPVPVG